MATGTVTFTPVLVLFHLLATTVPPVAATAPTVKAPGAVESITNVLPSVGSDVIAFPATSVPTDNATVCVPLAVGTAYEYVYEVALTFDISVAVNVAAPLSAILTTGSSAIASLNVAVIVTVSVLL